MNNKHLNIIRILKDECEKRNLSFWLYGGWGIDALLKKETREHEDIDLLVEYCNRDYFREMLKTFSDKIIEDKRERLLFTKENAKCDIRFFERMVNGDIVLDLDRNDPLVYPFPKNCVKDDCIGELKNVKLRVVTWEFHYIATAGYKYYINIPLRDKDKISLSYIDKNLSEAEKETLKRYFPGIKRENTNTV